MTILPLARMSSSTWPAETGTATSSEREAARATGCRRKEVPGLRRSRRLSRRPPDAGDDLRPRAVAVREQIRDPTNRHAVHAPLTAPAIAPSRRPVLHNRPMHLHVLGICGTFMGGLAVLAREAGHRVTGCDANVYPPMSDQLAALGIGLIEGYDASQLKLAPDLW